MCKRNSSGLWAIEADRTDPCRSHCGDLNPLHNQFSGKEFFRDLPHTYGSLAEFVLQRDFVGAGYSDYRVNTTNETFLWENARMVCCLRVFSSVHTLEAIGWAKKTSDFWRFLKEFDGAVIHLFKERKSIGPTPLDVNLDVKNNFNSAWYPKLHIFKTSGSIGELHGVSQKQGNTGEVRTRLRFLLKSNFVSVGNSGMI